jgi:phage shock protein E
MRKLFFIILFLASCSQKQGESSAVSTVAPAEFNTLLSGDAVLLDVRTPEEFAAGYIKGAINLDFKSSDFSKKLDSLDKSKGYLVYCASGGRSGRASELMNEKGFGSVTTLEGGIQAWQAEGLPLVVQ